uniref:Uncharacterized protein n=1 Tax=Cacopsylla melanoneura TaxID=428564 RepID=A0A8D8X7C1_9HEMI
MTSVFGLSCLIVVVFGVSMTDAYTNRYDGFDIDSVLKSERMYKSYLNCFLDLGPCNPMSEEGKRKLKFFNKGLIRQSVSWRPSGLRRLMFDLPFLIMKGLKNPLKINADTPFPCSIVIYLLN